MNSTYNSYFFNDFYKENGGGNYNDKEFWMPFFSHIADKIIELYDPITVLDAGCAMGYLVEALRDRGVEAYGIDISSYAINNVRDDIKKYCLVHSIEEPLPNILPDRYDIVITLEVLEHLYPEFGKKAIDNLCNYSDIIIFSSTSDDIDDYTHVNVQRQEYWARQFAKNSFFRNLIVDLNFICPWAITFEKRNDIENIIYEYEINSRINAERLNSKQHSCKAYFDTGNGFNENETALYAGAIHHDKLDFRIDVERKFINLRIDPIELQICIIKDLCVYNSSGFNMQFSTNGYNIENYILFSNTDPQIIINLNEPDNKFIHIKADILLINNLEYINVISSIDDLKKSEMRYLESVNNYEDILNDKTSLTNKNYSLENEIIIIQNDNKKLLNEYQLLQSQYEDLNCKNSVLEEKNEEISKSYKILENEKNYFYEHHHAALDEKNNLIEQIDQIYKSRSWKFIKKLQIIKKFGFKKKNNLNNNNLIYGLDSFSLNNNKLNVSGWVFLSDGNIINNVKIKIQYSKKTFYINILSGILRDDVYDVFKLENAKNCGFSGTIDILNFRKIFIYLEYSYNNETYNILLGEFKNPLNNYLGFMIKKINIRNIKTVLSMIFSGKITEVNSLFNFRTSNNGDIIDRGNIIEFITNRYNNHEVTNEYNNLIVDLIIPVYNGYEYFDKLFSSIEKTKVKHRLIIINDNSPDKNVEIYLNKLKEENAETVILLNDKNLGFVKTVNKGLNYSTNHVVILNTDIELPEMWLERLIYPIINDELVASATPYTNCGTICSFPKFGEDNNIFENLDLNDIDKYFQKILPVYEIIPTGVGFCMGLNKNVIKKVGYLDEDTFSKGYGEENDWCQRAIKLGFKNVQVENLFVYHKHGGSFLSEEKKLLLENNSKLLLKKHPDYNTLVAKYCELDPGKLTREFLVILISCCQVAKEVYFAFDHNIGGGASVYLNNKLKNLLNDKNSVFICKYDIDKNVYLLDFYYKNYKFSYYLNDLKDLKKLFCIINVDTILINEFVTYPKLYELFHLIEDIKIEFHSKIIFLLHDFYSICPTTNLINNKGIYCGIPDVSECEKCILNNRYTCYTNCDSISIWRKEWQKLLTACDDIIAFSNNSHDLLKQAYGDISNVSLIPHMVNYAFNINSNYKITESLNIGLLGVLSFHKGINIIRNMLNLIEKNDLNINIILIGESLEEIESSHFIQTGKYKAEELGKLTLKYDIDIFFISSIWPETFSYTTEEAIKMGYPVAVFDIGAPAERVINYTKGLIIPEISADLALDLIIKFMENKMNQRYDMSESKRILFLAEYISFSSRYRVEHFIEQLLSNGIKSDFFETKELSNVKLDEYESVVIYRCTYTMDMNNFILDCHRKNIKIYYDIDDYIFIYDKIKYLSFMNDSEYKDFNDYSIKIKRCMDLCDGFLTSTEQMKKGIVEAFPSIPVCVNRNVASIEMLSLSLRAIENKKQHDGKVIMGYFSGSHTHNADFDIIGDILLKLLDKYPNSYLKIGGCLKIDERFNKFNKRIQRFEFMDWRKLPDEIASIDINLMPLEDTFFHACKSENKWMEAALVKVSTVASYNEELNLVINNGVDGFLCRNGDDWEKALSSLIENIELRTNISTKANKRVIENYVTIKTGISAKNFILTKN